MSIAALLLAILAQTETGDKPSTALERFVQQAQQQRGLTGAQGAGQHVERNGRDLVHVILYGTKNKRQSATCRGDSLHNRWAEV